MATGRKTVVVGQVIDPTTWGNPLWDQSVQTFASAADRTAQFPAPKQGAVTWLEDVKELHVWDGTAWVPVATAKPVVLACPLGPLWVPGTGYSAPRLSKVAGRWTLSAVWSNASAGTFTPGYADLLTVPAAARVPGLPAIQVNATWVGFAGVSASSAISFDPVSGLVRWYLPGSATAVDDGAGATAAAGAIGGATQFSWDAAL